MTARPRLTIWSGLAVLAAGLLALPEADARGGHGGHAGGHAPRAPHFSAPRRPSKPPTPKPPRMPHAAAPARTNHNQAKNTQNHAKNTTNHARNATQVHANANRGAGSTTVHSASHALGGPSAYAYNRGIGSGAHRYRVYGYGAGYRNRYYGRRSGYGRSQGSNRAIISRLRSVHGSLARIDHDYRGHRVRAMHSVAMAIRQLSHRSMIYRGMGFAPGMNNGLALGQRRNGGGAGVRRPQRMTQAQSDARMSQALRTTQGIHMQLANQSYQTTRLSRAHGHIQQAIREMSTALAIR